MAAGTEAARDFLGVVREYATQGPTDRGAKIGTVYLVQGQSAQIRFDGESVVGQRYYPALSSYVPVVGDRVLLLPVGSRTSYVILGSLPA